MKMKPDRNDFYCVFINYYCVGMCIMDPKGNDYRDNILNHICRSAGFHAIYDYASSIPGYNKVDGFVLYTESNTQWLGGSSTPTIQYRIGSCSNSKSHQELLISLVEWTYKTSYVEPNVNTPYCNYPSSNMILILPKLEEVKTVIKCRYKTVTNGILWFCSDWVDN